MRTRPKWLAILAALVLSVGGLSAALAPSANASGTYAGFMIGTDDNFTVPDTGVTDDFPDLSGNAKELGPENGSDTKIGPISSAPTPMLDLTNPPAQVDLMNVWFDQAVDATTSDTWLYFAWQRESANGSGFIALEIQKSGVPTGCVYDASGGLLEPYADCNPWQNRSDGDWLLLWDQQGNSTDVYMRTWQADSGTWSNSSLLVEGTDYDADYSTDFKRGEVALNLNNVGIVDPEECSNIGNVIPSTVTGNSDSADFKDTVFAPIADALAIDNCATVTIVKETTPASADQDFAFTKTFNTLPTEDDVDTFTLNTGSTATPPVESSKTWTNVALGNGVAVTETLVMGWNLTDITCTEVDDSTFAFVEDLPAGTVTFDIDSAEDDITCTFHNEGTGAIEITKIAKHAAATTADKVILLGDVEFEVTPEPNEDEVAPRTTDPTDSTTGETCIAGLPMGDYNVHEVGAPTGYAAADDQTVTVDAVGTCDSGTQATVTFENVPLTDVTVTAHSQVTGGTYSQINCYNDATTPVQIGPTPYPTAPSSEPTRTVTDLVPGTYNCTIVVDP